MTQSRLVGILNLTPDSFSDGGTLHDAAAVYARARELLHLGGDVLDVGAESTRPGAKPLSAEEEWTRLSALLPELVRIARGEGREISVDTRHAETARHALALGVDWINDVNGLRDPVMCDVLREASCRVVLVHSLGVPADPARTLPEEADPVAILLDEARASIARLVADGISKDRLIYDPGIGFGKTTYQNLVLIRSADAFKTLGIPLYYGHSRKRFLQCVSDATPEGRDEVTAAFSSMLMLMGVDYLRVHDVGKHATLRQHLFGNE